MNWNQMKNLPFYGLTFPLHLFKVWYKQQLFQSGEEIRKHIFQSSVEVRPIGHRKHILQRGKTL